MIKKPEGYEANQHKWPCPDGPYCTDPECHQRKEGMPGGVMSSVAMAVEGCVYGVLLLEDGELQRAWIDPKLEPGTVCETLTFTDPVPAKVLRAVQKVLDVRFIPEVDPKTVNGVN